MINILIFIGKYLWIMILGLAFFIIHILFLGAVIGAIVGTIKEIRK